MLTCALTRIRPRRGHRAGNVAIGLTIASRRNCAVLQLSYVQRVYVSLVRVHYY